VPTVDVEAYRLEVRGVDGAPVACYTLDELRTKFRQHTVDATLQCAGNRRNEMSAVKTVKGGSWEHMAISNASWSGVRLRDVLADAGQSLGELGDELAPGAPRHIVFDGLDVDPLTGSHYGASIPIDVAQRVPDVLLAYEMNGEELPRDHGFPLRAIVPGIVGARQVKWLGSVRLSETESTCHWQTNDYKSFCPSVDYDTVDFASAPAIQELPVVSAICGHDVVGDGGTIHVTGYAWSGDGKGIVRVDVSGDGGKSWQAAELLPRNAGGDGGQAGESARRSRIYDWTRWRAAVAVSDAARGGGGGGGEQVVLVCKAVDSSYQTQPERVESIWNLRGVLNNCWHRVPVGAATPSRAA
jgi:sulfite oxidase